MRKPILVLGLLLLVSLVSVRGIDPLPVNALRTSYFDFLQILSPRDYADLPVRVVDIDEASLAEVGQWPWPRDVLADLVDTLTDMGAAVIAFDVVFAERDRYSPATLLDRPGFADLLADMPDAAALAAIDTDLIFADALSRSAVVLGVASAPRTGAARPDTLRSGLVQIGTDPAEGLIALGGITPLVPELAQAAQGVGSVNVAPMSNLDRIRQVPLLWRTDGGAIPALGLEALRLAFGETTFILRGVGDISGMAESVQLGGITIPTTASGEIWLRYRQDDPRLYVSAADVLRADNPEALRAALAGQIVLIGTSAAGLFDIRTTALGETVPGVSIHAQMIEQILLGDFLVRNDLIAGLELAALIFLGLLVAVLLARAGPLVALSSGAAAAAAVLAASWLAFTQAGLLIDATYPLLGGAINFALLLAYRFVVTDREKRKLRGSFAQYLAPSVLGQIEERNYRIALGGEMRPLSILFTDIRNFTAMSESMPPKELVPLLNELFSDLSQEVLDTEGTIDKFIGDSIMAFWNAPLPIADHEARAVRGAHGMRQALGRFHATGQAGGRTLEMGIGLHVGDAMVGNIGSRQRFNYSALGSAVNFASRIESCCKHLDFDLLASDAMQAATPQMAWLAAGRVAMQGISSRQQVHVLVGLEDTADLPEFHTLAAAHATLLEALGAQQEIDNLLEACREKAVRVMPRLIRFYDKIPARLADFTTPPDVAPRNTAQDDAGAAASPAHRSASAT